MSDIFELGYKVDTSNLSKANRDLKLLAQTTGTATGKAKGLTSNMAGLAKAAGAAAVAFGAFNAAKAGAGTIISYDKAVKGLQATLATTADGMIELNKQSRELGASTIYSASQVVGAQRFMAQAGLKQNEILASTVNILQLATAGNLDLARAADIATNVMGGMQLSVSDLAHVNDVLAKAASSSNTNIEQLGTALSYAAPLASAAGVSIEEASAAIGKLSDSGLQGSRAGTGLLGVIRQLSKVTPEAEKALKRHGLSVDDVNIKTHGLFNVMGKLTGVVKDNTAAFTIFGSEAAPAAIIMANASKEAGVLTTSLINSNGAAKEMSDTMSSAIDASVKGVLSRFEELSLVVGEKGGTKGLVGGLSATTEALDLLSIALKSTTTEDATSNYEGLAAILRVIAVAGYATFQVLDGITSNVIALARAANELGKFNPGAALDALSKGGKESLDDMQQILDFTNALYNPEQAKELIDANDKLTAQQKAMLKDRIAGQLTLINLENEYNKSQSIGLNLAAEYAAINAVKEKISVTREETAADREAWAEVENSFLPLKQRDDILKQLTETQKMLNDQVADFVNISDEEASGLNDLMSRAKTMAEGVDEYGDAWTRTGNKAIDALGSMSAVMAKTHGTDKKYADIMADLRKEGQQDTKEYIKLEKLRAKNSVHGSMEMMAASVSMYEEGSDAQKAAHAAYLVMQAVELAGNLQLAISNATVAVANQGKGDPYTAFARIAAMGVMMGGVLSQIGASFGTSGGASASYESVAQSGSGVLGGGETQSVSNLSERLMDVNSDQYNELREINKNTRFLNKATVSSASALYATGDISRLSKDLSIFKKSGIVDFADSIGDMLNNPLFGTFGDIGGIGSTILGGIFGGGTKKTSTGYGINIGGTQGNVGVSGYQGIKKRTDGGWFGKSKTSYYDIASQVDPRVQEALASTYKYLGSTLSDLGSLLDRDVTSVIGGLKVTTGKIELSGLSGEAVQKKLSEAISIQADTWAYSLFGGLIQTYQKMEESAFDTLSRLAIDKAVVEDVLSSTGKTVTGDAIALSQALIEIAGSLEGLTDSAKTYYDAFFTDAEKFADLTAKLSGALGSVNLELPATRQGYRALVESLDLTTQSGKEAYVTLLNLSDSADKYYKDIGDLQTKSFDELRKALENTFDSLIGSVSTSQMKYMTAQSSLSNILELARSGVMPTAQGIQGTLTALQGNNQSSYATYEDFARDQRITAGMVNELIGYTNGTMTIEDQMLNELQAQTAIMSGNINSAPVAYGGQSSQTSELITEVRAMKADIREFKQQSRDVGIQLIAQATDTTDVLEKFDIIGMPGVRV